MPPRDIDQILAAFDEMRVEGRQSSNRALEAYGRTCLEIGEAIKRELVDGGHLTPTPTADRTDLPRRPARVTAKARPAGATAKPKASSAKKTKSGNSKA